MSLVNIHKLLSAISPPMDHLLATQLIDEFVSAERRYIQRDWEPAQLDGGQFAEISARIVYHLDSGNLNLTKSFESCGSYIDNDQTTHAILPRHDAIHIFRVLRTIYKFRSQRGAVHISPTYKPNHMDSKIVIECVRWTMNELLRVFWNSDRESVAKAIRELMQFDIPAIADFNGKLIVQRTDLNAEEEILLLLHYAGEEGFSRQKIGRSAQWSSPRVSEAIGRLILPNSRQIVQLPTGNYRLTDLGARRVREKLADKLLLQ